MGIEITKDTIEELLMVLSKILTHITPIAFCDLNFFVGGEVGEVGNPGVSKILWV